MQLSVTEREQLYAILEKYDQNPKVQQMREFIQHGDVTTYQHCKNVVLVSWWLNHRLHLGADETSLAVGAFLHDFYLYDWHKKGTFHGIRRLFEMHGFSHPGCACVNAEKVFHITKKEQSIISSHMWPLTFRHVPSCREAIIVCLADKYCAVVESMFQRSRAGPTSRKPHLACRARLVALSCKTVDCSVQYPAFSAVAHRALNSRKPSPCPRNCSPT